MAAGRPRRPRSRTAATSSTRSSSTATRLAPTCWRSWSPTWMRRPAPSGEDAGRDAAEGSDPLRAEPRSPGRPTSDRSRCPVTSSSRRSRSATRTGCCRACTSVCARRSKQRYGERLEQLYAELERKQNEELLALRNLGSGLTVLEKVGKALEGVLGVTDIDVSQPVRLRRPGRGFARCDGIFRSARGQSSASRCRSAPSSARPAIPSTGRRPSRPRWGTRRVPIATFDQGSRQGSDPRLGPRISTSRRSSTPIPSSGPDSRHPRPVSSACLLTGANGLPRPVHVPRVAGASRGDRGKADLPGPGRRPGRRPAAAWPSAFEGDDPALERRFLRSPPITSKSSSAT